MTFGTQDTSYPGSPQGRGTTGSKQPVIQPCMSRADKASGHSPRSGCVSHRARSGWWFQTPSLWPHGPHNAVGRVGGEFKQSHRLQLCVVWQHENSAVLTSSNLKPPLRGEEGPSESLPHPDSAVPPGLRAPDLQLPESADCGSSRLRKGGRGSKGANNLLGPFFSELATFLGDLSARQVQPEVRSENHNNVSIYLITQQMFADHLLCSGHSWYWGYKTGKTGFLCLKTMQLEGEGGRQMQK